MFSHNLGDIPVYKPVNPLVPHGGYPLQRIYKFGEPIAPPLEEIAYKNSMVSRPLTREKNYGLSGNGPLNESGVRVGIPKSLYRHLTPGEVTVLKAREMSMHKAYQNVMAQHQDIEKMKRREKMMREKGLEIDEQLKMALHREKQESKLARKKWKEEERAMMKMLREYEQFGSREAMYQDF